MGRLAHRLGLVKVTTPRLDMRFVLGRTAAALLTVMIAAILVFVLLRLAPGDPAALIAGDHATTLDIATLRAELGLDQPLWRQLALWLQSISCGDFGISIYTQRPVRELIAQRVEPTVSIALLTTLITVMIAVPLGTLAAYRAGAWLDHVVTLLATIGMSAPVFLIGYLLILGFSVHLAWFPVQGYVSVFEDPVAWLRGIALPCINLAVVYGSILMRMTRASVLEVMKEDYIRTARAKGLGVHAVLLHALRNAALPIVTSVGVSFSLLVGGVVVTESVFSIPGMGRLLIESVARRDYPTIQGVLLTTAMAVVAINFLVDLSYRMLDPRVRD